MNKLSIFSSGMNKNLLEESLEEGRQSSNSNQLLFQRSSQKSQRRILPGEEIKAVDIDYDNRGADDEDIFDPYTDYFSKAQDSRENIPTTNMIDW